MGTPRETLLMIAQDMADDARRFDGLPFNGSTVAEYFGNHGAAIAALAEIVATLLPEEQPDVPKMALPVMHKDVPAREWGELP